MVFFGDDDYTDALQTDRKQPLWRAKLSDGRVVTMDDGRPGVSPPSAWLRLRSFLNETGLGIVSLWAQFRSNVQKPLPDNADGYFFSKAALGILTEKNTYHFYILGALRDSRLTVFKYAVPELILMEVEERDPAKAGDCLIENKCSTPNTTACSPPAGPHC